MRGPNKTTVAVIAVALAGMLGACQAEEATVVSEPETARAMPEPVPFETEPAMAAAELRGDEGSEISGVVSFTEEDGAVRVIAQVSGVEPGLHGIHLHEDGDCSAEDFSSAGGHFDPTGVSHGGPYAAEHHSGDFGNVEVGEDGTGHLDLVSEMLTVDEGETGVVGRAVILHAAADDLTSQPSGAAGARIACGVVELVPGDLEEPMEEDAGPGADGSEGPSDAR